MQVTSDQTHAPVGTPGPPNSAIIGATTSETFRESAGQQRRAGFGEGQVIGFGVGGVKPRSSAWARAYLRQFSGVLGLEYRRRGVSPDIRGVKPLVHRSLKRPSRSTRLLTPALFRGFAPTSWPPTPDMRAIPDFLACRTRSPRG
jgi:hypothetical protein